MEPKPLTSQRRAEIEKYRQAWSEDIGTGLVVGVTAAKMLADLTAAEAFWRNAVKNANLDGPAGEYNRCPFCDAKFCNHSPDCPWLLAHQE